MYIILVYDFNEKRVGKALKIARKYLTWIQNSVFEGEISKSNYKKMMKEFNLILDKKKDSLIIYNLDKNNYHKKITIGITKNKESQFI